MIDEIELKAISNLVKHSRHHGLEVECIWSLVHEISGMARIATSEDIAKACDHALCEWDI